MRVGGVEVELSWQAQGVVRLRRLAEVNVVVPGIGVSAAEVFQGLGLRNCLAGLLDVE